MNEELLKQLYTTYNLASKGDLNTFINDMQNENVAKSFHAAYLSTKGDFNTFKSDLYRSSDNIPSGTISSSISKSNPTTPTSNGKLDHSVVKSYIGNLESDGKYNILNKKGTSATGKYQHVWGGSEGHGPSITRITGVKSQEEYLNNPDAQEKYQDYLQPIYEKKLPELRQLSIQFGKDYSDEEIMYIYHHSWNKSDNYIKGEDVPDKKGLDAAIAKGRARGLTTPRNLTGSVVNDNTQYSNIGDLLPVRKGELKNESIDVRLIDKLKDFLPSNELLITSARKGGHTNKEQLAGRSVDVNFVNRDINPEKIYNAILSGQQKGLRMVYEVADPRVYKALIERDPRLKDHIVDTRNTPGYGHVENNHFSVYHADNYTPDKNLLPSSENLSDEKLRNVRNMKVSVYEEVQNEKKRTSTDKAASTALNAAGKLITEGVIGSTVSTVSKIFSPNNDYQKALHRLVSTGKLNISGLSNTELVELANSAEAVADLKKQAAVAKKDYNNQIQDKGFFEGVGDIFAGSPVDKLLGINSDTRLDTKNGKININTAARGSYFSRDELKYNDFYLSPDQVLNLKGHPLAKKPNDPNDPFNKELRRIQDTILRGDQKLYDHETAGHILRTSLAQGRIETLKKELTKLGGENVFKTLESFSKKIQDKTITDEETQQYTAFVEKLNSTGGALDQYDEAAKQYTLGSDSIKAIEGKYGALTKVKKLRKEDQASVDAVDRETVWWRKRGGELMDFMNDFTEVMVEMPKTVGLAAGVLGEAVTGTDIGATNSAKAQADINTKRIKSTRDQREFMGDSMYIDGKQVVFKNNRAVSVLNKDGYAIDDEATLKIAQEKLNTEHNGNQSDLDNFYNPSALWEGFKDNAPMLASMFYVGGIARGAATKATAKALEGTASNMSRILSKPFLSARGIESMSMMPVYLKDTMEQSINDGAVTPGQIIGTTMVKLGVEAIAESLSVSGLGKMLAGKGITSKIIKDSLDKKLVDVVKFYATGKITATAFRKYAVRAALELGQELLGEGFEEAIVAATEGSVNEMLNSVLDTNYDQQQSSWNEIASAGAIGMAAASAMSGTRFIGEMIGYKEGIKENYKSLAASVIGGYPIADVKGSTVANPEVFKQYLTAAVEAGQIDKKEADKYSSAIQSAAERTKFTKDIDTSQGFWSRVKGQDKGLEAKDKFINYARNIAFNQALTGVKETNNNFEESVKSAKVGAYEKIISELEMNAYKNVFSIATPTMVGTDKKLDKAELTQLSNKQESILDGINSSSFNSDNKALAFEIRMKKAANDIIKSRGTTSEKAAEELGKDNEALKKAEEALRLKNQEEKDEDAVLANTGTPKQVQAVLTKSKAKLDELFDNHRKLTGTESPDFSIDLVRDIIDQAPEILKGELADYATKKLKTINAKAYSTQIQKLKAQQKKVSATNSKKATPSVSYDTRYKDNPELEKVDGARLITSFKGEIDGIVEAATQAGDQEALNVFGPIKLDLESGKSYRDLYTSNPQFRTFVDEQLQKEAKQPNTEKDTSTVSTVLTKAGDLKVGDKFIKGDKTYTVKELNEDINKNGIKIINSIVTEEGVTFNNLNKVKANFSVNKVVSTATPEKGAEVKVIRTKEQKEAIAKINKLIEDGKKATLVSETSEKESHYSLLGKIYKRVSTYVKGKLNYDGAFSVTSINNSLPVGNFFDTFARLYFNNPNLTVEEFKAALEARPDKAEFKNMVPENVFAQGIIRFGAIAEQIKKDLGDDVVFITDEIFVYAELPNDKFDGVAGTLDMLVVDKLGQVHIYDFKSKKNGTVAKVEESHPGGSSAYTWQAQQTAYSRLLQDTFGYTPLTKIIVLPVTYETVSFTGDPNNETEINNFKPAPSQVKWSTNEPFIYDLAFDPNNKLVVNLNAHVKGKSQPPPPAPESKGQQGQGSATRKLITLDGYKAKLSDELLIKEYFEADSPIYIEKFTRDSRNGEKEEYVRIVAYFQVNDDGSGSFGTYGKDKQAVILQEGVGSAQLAKDLVKKITDSGGDRLETRVSEKPYWRRRMFTPITIGAIKGTKYSIERSKTNDPNADYILKGSISPIIFSSSNYSDVKQSILDDLEGNLNAKKITKDEYDKQVKAVEYHFSTVNKPTIKEDALEKMAPHLYIAAQSWENNTPIVLLNKGNSGEDAVPIKKFMRDYSAKNPEVSKKDLENIENILLNPNVNGKVIYIEGNLIIPFDTLKISEDPTTLASITKKLTALSKEEAGKASWRTSEEESLATDVRKRIKEAKDYKSEPKKQNIHGRILEFFSAGPENRNAQIQKGTKEGDLQSLYYIIRQPSDENPLEDETKRIYVTLKEAIAIVSDIRVHIDHSVVKNATDPDVQDTLKRVLRAPMMVSNEKNIVYNYGNIMEPQDSEQSPPVEKSSVKVEINTPTSDQSIPEEKDITEVKTSKKKSVAKSTAKPSTKPDTKIKPDDILPFKVSNEDYSGKVEEAVAYIKTRFEELGVEVDDAVLRNLANQAGIQGSKVWGAFHNAMVTLSSLSGEKIGKHEAMHVAEIMFHTDSQIKAFRQEALARYGKELGITKTKVDDLTPEELSEIREAIATEFEDYKNSLLLPEGFSKSFPAISKFIEKLFNFLKKNYLIGKSYITNKKSIDDLFYEVENNILGRDFLGRRKKNTRDIFEESVDTLYKPDFKISNWNTKATREFSDFLSKNVFTRFLNNTYDKSNINEILSERKNLTLESITKRFQKNLKKYLDLYKAEIVAINKLKETSNEYIKLSALLDDIHNQYVGDKANEAFKLIVNKALGNRYAGIVDFDNMDSDDTVTDDDSTKETDESTEEINNLESWQTKQGKVDAKTKSSARLREFFSEIPMVVRRVVDGKSVRNAVKSGLLFNTKYYSGEYIHNKLLNELSDNSNYDDFISKINSLVGKYHFMGDIIQKIMGLSDEQVLEAYDNKTLKLPDDLLTRQDYYKEQGCKLWIIKDIYYAIGDQNNQSPVKVLKTIKKDVVTEVQIAKSVQNTDYDNAVTTIKQTVENKIQDDDTKKQLVDSLQAVLTAIKERKQLSGVITEAFSELGYEASNELLMHLLPTVSANDELTNLAELSSIIQDVIDGIDAGNETIDASLYGINKIAKLITTYSSVSSGLSYMNVEGENEFAHKNSSFLSRTQGVWSKGKARIKEWANKMRYVNGNPDDAIVLHSYMDIYDDIINKNNDFRILDDGFTQVQRQENSGKAYADMTEDEIAAASLNLFLTKNNQKNAGNTIKPNHALFHFLVFSDSPVRKILHAPVLKLDEIVSKLSKIIYGELDRIDIINRVKEVDIFEKLNVSGKLLQTIPELNNVDIINSAGNLISFKDAFNKGNNWTNFNDSHDSNITHFRYVNKKGEVTKGVSVGDAKKYSDVLNVIIKEIIRDNYNNYVDTILNDDVQALTANIDDSELESFYTNTFYYNIATKIMFSGDPAHYKPDKHGNTNTESVKRDKQQIAPNIGLIFEKAKFKIAILSDVFKVTKNVNDTETSANLTDAQAYHTLERRIEIMKAMPNWELHEKEIMEVVDKINNNDYTQKDLDKIHFQILKPFLYTQVDRSIKTGETTSANFKIPLQLKDSEAVLLPTEAYRVYGETNYVRPNSVSNITSDKYVNPELARTLFMMEKTGTSTVIFESGSKAEVFGKIDIENLTDDEIDNLGDKIVELNNSDYGIQMNVPRKDMEAKIGQGSQEHKIMSANVDENWTYKLGDTTYSGQSGLNDILQKIQTLNAEENLTKVIKKLTKEDGSIDINKVLDIVSEGLLDKALNVDMIEGLEILSKDGKTLIPLELFGKKAEKILNALFKAVSKIKGKGAALVNKSAFGYIRDNASVTFENVKDGKKQIKYTNDLQLVKDENGNILHYEAIVPVYDPIIYNFVDINGELLLDSSGKPIIPEKLLYAFFYRIPTEDKYSMFPIKIKKFSMPVEGGGIMLPREATETAGLDFDIDKLYGYYYNFKVHYPAEFKTYVVNRLAKYLVNPSGEESDEKVSKEEIKEAKENAIRYFDALEDSNLVDDFNDDDLKNFQVLKEGFQSVKESYEYLGNKFSTTPENFIETTESSLKNSKSAHNLKLDIYFSLVNTAAYTKDALTGGSKKRLEDLRDKLFGGQKKITYSFGDPTFITKTANKNITGKRLIGIFANANSFYNLIQGVTKVELLEYFDISINGTDYSMSSIGGVNSQISKNIAELLFASTEDVKNPVLELLGINTQTAGLLITLMSMTDENNDIIKFEDAISIVLDPEIQEAAKEASRTGKRFTQVYKGTQYKQLVNISDAYNNIVSASKIDQAIGPDFFTVENKTTTIDSILETERKDYPFIMNSVREILPSQQGGSKITQLNTYRKALDYELTIFKEIFSFLKSEIRGTLKDLTDVSKNGKLNAKQKDKLAYNMYDAAIQVYLDGKDELSDLIDNFPQEFLDYDFPGNTGILRQAIEKTSDDILKMRWVNINASDALEQYKEAFSDLFEEDPDMAVKLAKYAFLTGTKFKMDSIVKIVPNEFFKTTEGEVIRSIINGNDLHNYLTVLNTTDAMIFNNYKMILSKEELTTGEDGTSVLAVETYYPKRFIWNTNEAGDDVIYKNIDKTSDYIEYKVIEKTKFPDYLTYKNKSRNFAKNSKMKDTSTPTFDTLPGKSSTPTMTYAGIGSRETPPEVLEQMTRVAKYLEEQGYTLRSGAAAGADTAFENGVKSKKEIFKGFDKTGDKEIKIAHEIHPNLKGAMEGSKKKAIAAGKDGEKSAWAVQNLMARNTNQIFGKKLDTPVDFVLAYDPSGWTGVGPRPKKGGTLQAIDLAARKGIPVINMTDQNWKQQLLEILKNNEPPINNNETTAC